MKKIITTLLMLALVISLMAAFTSCGEPAYEKLPADERAIELDKLSSEKMDQATSYDAKTSGIISFKISGIDVTADISGKQQLLLADNGTYFHQEETTEISIADKTEITKSIRGYVNGKAYTCDVSSGKKTAFYSEIPFDDYIAHLNRNSDDVLSAFSAASASEKTSVKRSDGGWSLVFEDFSDEAKQDLAKQFEALIGGTVVTDAKISIVLDADLYYKSFIMDLFFPSDSDFKELSFRIDFSSVNTGTVEIDEIDFDDYTKIPDIRVLDKLDDVLNYVPEEGEKQSVKVTISQHSVSNGTVSRAREIDKIVYETVDGKLKYEINAEIPSNSNEKYVISYEDGTRTVEHYNSAGHYDDTTTKKTDDDVEKAYVLGILNTVKYNRSVIKKMKVSDNDPNSYIITCDVPSEFMDTSAYKSATLTVIVTLDANGEISKIDSEIYIKASNLNTNTYTLTAVCVFGDFE